VLAHFNGGPGQENKTQVFVRTRVHIRTPVQIITTQQVDRQPAAGQCCRINGLIKGLESGRQAKVL
jgi:ribosomal protein L34E